MQIIYCVINNFIFLLRCPAESMRVSKGLPTENCPNCLYFNISYFPIETPVPSVHPKKFEKVPSVFQEESKVCLWSRPVVKKKDKNLTRWEIVGFKKSYYLNIPFKNLQKIRNTSKKTQKYSIFDQILEFLNQNWPFSNWMENLMQFRKFVKLNCVGVSCEKLCGCGFEGIFMIQISQKSFKSIHDRAEIIFNHDFESNRPCNWIRVSCVVRDRSRLVTK